MPTQKYLQSILNLFLISISIIACNTNGGSDSPEPETPDGSNLPPVETLEPNTSYSPNFDNQTRANGNKTETAYTVEVFANGLTSPWGMSNLPDGRIIVTEKRGTLRIISLTGTVSNPINGLPTVNSSGQGGLLDVAIDPDFSTTRMIYWTFSQDGGQGTATAVAKGRLSNDEQQIEDAEVIYTALPEFNGTAHYGSRLEWDGEGNLFVSTGERSSASIRGQAQELDAALGKILRISTEGNALESNPFYGESQSLPEIYSYGHRNVQGIAIHPVTGDLWEAELGPRGGDEVNLIIPGNNYGWPVISYGIEYSGSAIGQGITYQEGMEQPIYYWDPVISPSGITFYSGNLISEWENNLFLAALSGQHIARLVIEDNEVVAEERLLVEEGKRFRDVLEGMDGALYAVTDENNASLYRITL